MVWLDWLHSCLVELLVYRESRQQNRRKTKDSAKISIEITIAQEGIVQGFPIRAMTESGFIGMKSGTRTKCYREIRK